MIPLALYVHVPWCVRKCPYCDFNSHALAGDIPSDDYIEALVGDLASDIERFDERREISSIFFGGGTPSLMPATAIARFIRQARTLIGFDDDIEVTLEANPGTVQEGRMDFEGLLEAGVNRLSLGVQSFNDTHLAALGRIHSSAEASVAYELARKAGFANINLDLMHGLPGQDASSAMADLDAALRLRPEHISWYQLTIEPNTLFFKRPPQLPDEDMLTAIESAGLSSLDAAGYARYEISAFARDRKTCRHNVNYWQFGDYLGIGAGAHGKITTRDNVIRTTKTRMPADYLSAPGRQENRVTPGELPTEFLMNALRLIEGFSLADFESRTGLSRAVLADFIRRAADRGLLHARGEHIAATALGVRFLDTLLSAIDQDTIARSGA